MDGSGEKWGDKREKKINWVGEKKKVNCFHVGGFGK